MTLDGCLLSSLSFHNSIELFHRLLDTDLRKRILIDISGNVIKLCRVAGVQAVGCHE